MFSYPKTYVVDVAWRKETEWHKLLPKVLKLIDLKYHWMTDNLKQTFYALVKKKIFKELAPVYQSSKWQYSAC